MSGDERVPVLVVDPDEDVRAALRDVLEDEGYTVWEASSPKAALAVMRTAARRLVVLADVVPHGHARADTSGHGLLGTLLDDARLVGRHAYVLMTTNPAWLCGAVGHLADGLRPPVLSKPFDLEALLDVVATQACGARREARPVLEAAVALGRVGARPAPLDRNVAESRDQRDPAFAAFAAFAALGV